MTTVMDHHFGHQKYDDIAELCGGSAGTTRLLLRRGYRGGPNFDIICGCNLTTP